MKRPQEIALQADCVQAFNNTYCLKTSEPRLMLYSTPNEVGSGTKSQRALEIQQKVSSGMLGGVADLTLLATDGNLLFIEMKLPHNDQQPNQIDFEFRVNKLGFEYVVVRSKEEFEQVVNTWLASKGVITKSLRWLKK